VSSRLDGFAEGGLHGRPGTLVCRRVAGERSKFDLRSYMQSAVFDCIVAGGRRGDE
jgi:hypothetical protein